MPIDPRRTALALALALVAAAPFAWAQDATPKKKKKGATPAASASASDTAEAPASTPPAPADTTPPAPTPLPAEGAAENMPASAPVSPPPASKSDMTDVTEKPGQSYIFIGLRYRGDVIPKFMVNIFVDEGKTFYSNMIGLEADFRKDNFSMIPSLTYQTLGTGGPVLFLQKNVPSNIPGNWSEVDSSMKALYAMVDLMWSTKVHKNIDFEYGAGFGLGVVFGNLVTNWVYGDNNGALKATTGPYAAYTACPSGGTQPGCNLADHQNATVAKTGGYTEPSWAHGGSKPVIFPWISVPQLGLRFKPIKQMEARLTVGFALTGFWFGLSANYGLEKSNKIADIK